MKMISVLYSVLHRLLLAVNVPVILILNETSRTVMISDLLNLCAGLQSSTYLYITFCEPV